MEKNASDFFNSHSKNFLEMALSFDRVKIIENPDGYGKNTGVCGDTVEFFLMVRDDQVEKITFVTNGCVSTYACANTAAVMAENKSVTQTWEITPQRIIDYLQTLPPESYHCAELTAGALYRALRNLQEIMQRPWKKPYHRHKP